VSKSVFLSYRRADSAGHAGRIDADLEQAFGRPVVFRDVESIDAGADFVEVLEAALAGAQVCIVVIGRGWLDGVGADGRRRLEDPNDIVRLEIETALQRSGTTVLPVLVNGATMPGENQLPPSLRRLARLQAIELSETRWDFDMARLVEALRAAGVAADPVTRTPRWVWPTLAVLLVALVVLAAWCLRDDSPGIDAYTGLWYMPNGNFWSIREQDAGFWIEETHHESKQVWMRGEGGLEDQMLLVTLKPVFDHDEWRFVHRLRLTDDGGSLVGTVRRADRESEKSVVLTRGRP
jgi:hypothetical protein